MKKLTLAAGIAAAALFALPASADAQLLSLGIGTTSYPAYDYSYAPAYTYSTYTTPVYSYPATSYAYAAPTYSYYSYPEYYYTSGPGLSLSLF